MGDRNRMFSRKHDRFESPECFKTTVQTNVLSRLKTAKVFKERRPCEEELARSHIVVGTCGSVKRFMSERRSVLRDDKVVLIVDIVDADVSCSRGPVGLAAPTARLLLC